MPERPGVTPSLYERYALRTADKHAAFVFPYLKPGITLVDIGCGLGSITIGLAKAVAPGGVVGVDLNEEAIAKAQASAREQGVANVEFRVGSAYDLPFEDASLDAVFAHMVLMHLDAPGRATAEAFRVVGPGGMFAGAERAEQGDVRGNSNPTIERAWDIFMQWQGARGSDLRYGPRLRGQLLEAGFQDVTAAPAYHDSSLDEHILQFRTIFRSESLTRVALERGWAAEETLDSIRSAIDDWGADPRTLWGMARVEALGWKR